MAQHFRGDGGLGVGIANFANEMTSFYVKGSGAGALRFTMGFELAPTAHCVLVTPERERKHLSWISQALKAFDRDKAVDGVEHVLGADQPAALHCLPAGARHHALEARSSLG